MTSNLESLSYNELTLLREQIDDTIKVKLAHLRVKALAEASAAANKYGFELRDLVNPSKLNRQGSGKAPTRIYTNPNNSNEIWGGRGRRPAWLNNWTAAGNSLDEL